MPKMSGIEYNEDYFERGLQTGKSNYQNYRWIPELTIPMAMSIVDFLELKPEHKILDFGCAKGYLVKALRLLRRQAWGIDISEYALSCTDPEVSQYCVLSAHRGDLPKHFDFCIAKDVFEHLTIEGLDSELRKLPADYLFAIIPLGEDKRYRAPLNNCDVTHKICADEGWWENFFVENDYELLTFRHRIDGIKDAYYGKFPKAHGFFVLRKSKGNKEKRK